MPIVYVSPDGDDASNGAFPARRSATEGPLRTLRAARDRARALRSEAQEDVRIQLRGGFHNLSETLVLGVEDSGAPRRRLIIEPYLNERPIIGARAPVTGWSRVSAPVEGAPANATGRLWEAPLPQGGGNFLSLYAGLRRLPRACTPGFIPTTPPPKKYWMWYGEDQTRIDFPSGAMRAWENIEDAELVVRPMAPWLINRLPLARVDVAQGVAYAAAPATYQMVKLGLFAAPDTISAWVENVPEGLCAPGAWLADTRRGKVVYWPLDDQAPGEDVAFAALKELVRIEGEIDEAGPKDAPACWIELRGLTFACAERDESYSEERRGKGLLSDWDFHDTPNAALRLRGAERCAVEDCVFSGLGGAAVRLDLHAQYVRVVGNRIDDVGGAGVLACGYGPGTKNANGWNLISDNEISRCGAIVWHAPAVMLHQSGENEVRNNKIYDLPYCAIMITGVRELDKSAPLKDSGRTIRWGEIEAAYGVPGGVLSMYDARPLLHARGNVVQDNEIYDVVKVLGDGNAIYLSATGHGNLIRRNYIHDCFGSFMTGVIRTDDFQWGATIEGNVIYRCGCAALMLKHRNHCENNLVVDLRDTAPDGRRTRLVGYFGTPFGPTRGSRIRKNVFVSLKAGQPICQEGNWKAGGEWFYGEMGFLKDAWVDANLYWCAVDPAWASAHLESHRADGVEINSLSADPDLVIDEARRRFTIGNEKVLKMIGFEQIDLSRVGPRPRDQRI